MAYGITVRIKNFAEYRPRKEIRHPHWFKCSNRILEDEDFYDFSFNEFAVWIYILSIGSQKDTSDVFINFEAAERKCRMSEKTVLSAIEKLKRKQIDILSDHDTHTASTQPDHDQHTNCVLELKEGIERRDPKPSRGHAQTLPLVARIWNEKTKSRPKADRWAKNRMTAAGKLAKTGITDEQWIKACEMVEASDFLSGRNGKWTSCNVDWLLKEANITKVLEGNYVNGSPAAEAQGAGSMRGA